MLFAVMALALSSASASQKALCVIKLSLLQILTAPEAAVVVAEVIVVIMIIINQQEKGKYERQRYELTREQRSMTRKAHD